MLSDGLSVEHQLNYTINSAGSYNIFVKIETKHVQRVGIFWNCCDILEF